MIFFFFGGMNKITFIKSQKKDTHQSKLQLTERTKYSPKQNKSATHIRKAKKATNRAQPPKTTSNSVHLTLQNSSTIPKQNIRHRL